MVSYQKAIASFLTTAQLFYHSTFKLLIWMHQSTFIPPQSHKKAAPFRTKWANGEDVTLRPQRNITGHQNEPFCGGLMSMGEKYCRTTGFDTIRVPEEAESPSTRSTYETDTELVGLPQSYLPDLTISSEIFSRFFSQSMLSPLKHHEKESRISEDFEPLFYGYKTCLQNTEQDNLKIQNVVTAIFSILTWLVQPKN